MRKVVGRNFARLRLAKGFTQERLPEVSGFTLQFYQWARRDPTVVTLYHLAQALGKCRRSHMPDQETLHESARALKRKKS
jgi:transcriptional regulator with XRE-family HTH domain